MPNIIFLDIDGVLNTLNFLKEQKKIKLIELVNPGWKDLSLEPGFSKRLNHG